MSGLISRRVLFFYLSAAITYLALMLIVPTEAETLQRYHISELRLDIVKLTIAIPLLAIWFAAFYGYDKFKHYAAAIHTSQDGVAFNHIANGLGALAVSMPVASILSTISTYVAVNAPDSQPAMTIVRNYAAIFLALVAFWLIHKGSRSLKKVTVRKKWRYQYDDFVVMLTAFLAVFYTYLIFHNPERQVPAGEAWRATYYLPDWLVLFTIILPYLFIWHLGFQAVLNIHTYAGSVKGVLYKQMLGFLEKGMIGIILLSVVLQLLINFGSLFRSMSLGPLLGIVYLLLIVMTVGYVYVAVGAKRLQKIEEV